MIALSFRIKLLLAMMLLIAGVTGATLYLTQEKVQSTYLKLFQDQFESEVNYFSDQQDYRLHVVKEGCQKLAASPELRASLANGDGVHAYELAVNSPALTNVFKTSAPFLVLDANGQVLRDAEARNGRRKPIWKSLEAQLGGFPGNLDKLDDQTISPVELERLDKTELLYEVVVTRVADAEGGKTLGALVCAILFADEGNKEVAMKALSQGGIESGLWLNHQLYSSRTITNNAERGEFSKLMTDCLKTNAGPKQVLNATLGGVPRRVFIRRLNPHSGFPPAYQVALFSMDGAFKAERELRLQIMLFSIAAMAGALVLSLFIAHGLSVPLQELVKGTAAVRDGNYQYKVPVRSGDELGELAVSFNEMAEGLHQRLYYRTLLNMVADEKVAQALVNGELVLGGEVRELTVLFCDIRGFTAHVQNMPPERVIDMLNEHMTALTAIVKQHNGVLDKFVGDLLMAIFGAPISHEQDTLNAARCAVRLIQERERLNATTSHQLKIGIGIATGQVVAGCMGSMDRLNYTVLGERVNLGSRLCSQAGPGQVIIDQTTADKLGAAARTRPLPALNLKGFSESVVAYELQQVLSWELAAEPETTE